MIKNLEVKGLSPSVSDKPAIRTIEEQKLAPLYWVVMHDDPVTTMEFVVDILIKNFGLEKLRAETVMLSIHHTGLERVALMPLERAEFKVETVHKEARANGFPLTCTIEPE